MNFPGVQDLIADYQRRAQGTPADEIGYYVAPFAYAQAQVLEQAVESTGGLDDAELADYAREGSASALAALADLRATVFVGSLSEAEAELRAGGWTTEGPLGGGASLLWAVVPFQPARWHACHGELLS